MPHVDVGAAAVAGAAGHILERHGLAGADGRVGDAVRPHVIALQHQAVPEAAMDLGLQCVEVVVAGVGLLPEGAKLRERALAGQGINEIQRVLVEHVRSFGSHVADLRDKAIAQIVLNHEIPVAGSTRPCDRGRWPWASRADWRD